MKSSIAAPSLRNSGLLATSHVAAGAFLRAAATISALVPTGTVLLMTTIASWRKCGAMSSTTAHRADRSAAPSSACGVPTARNTSLAAPTAAARSVVKCSRLGRDVALDQFGQARLVDRESRRALSRSIFFWSISTHVTSLPLSAKQVPVTRPT